MGSGFQGLEFKIKGLGFTGALFGVARGVHL
jgi:hypothetical protein